MIEQKETDMENKSCVLLSIKNMSYVIDVINIMEILELPALRHAVGLPPYIAGFVNVRGEIMVALDLKACFGDSSRHYALKDHLIVIEGENYSFCLVSPEITDLVQVERSQIISEALLNDIAPLVPFVSNVAKHDEKIVFFIDPLLLEKHLLKTSPEVFKSSSEWEENKVSILSENEDEQKIFEERALSLTEKVISPRSADQLTFLMIILLNQEYYAVDTMREFCPIQDFSSVPWAPPCVFGLFNLRGHVLPLVDIKHILQGQRNEIKTTSKALIVNFEDTSLGILVDDVVNLVFVNQSDYRAVPLSVKVISQAFVKSTVKYEKEVIPVLDIMKMLKSIQVQ